MFLNKFILLKLSSHQCDEAVSSDYICASLNLTIKWQIKLYYKNDKLTFIIKLNLYRPFHKM